MERALYDPEGGYYASGRSAIGRGGDFITNVSIGPLFGKLMATEFHAMWCLLGKPSPFTIVEQGANTGDFAHDTLTAIAAHPNADWRDAVRYQIVEPFPHNVARQQERLAPWNGKVAWFASLEELPPLTGVHFSNELLDAMPVHALTFRDGQWRERYVAASDGTFQWTEGPLSTPALAAFVPRLATAEIEGMQTEVNLDALEWMDAIAAKLERGYILIADYGLARCDYYLPTRTEGTLTGYRAHQRSRDLLAEPGSQDLTAHVDFTSVAEQAIAAGLEVAGFTDQHHYMVGLGKEAFPDSDTPLTSDEQKERRAFASLMHPALMGRGFRFLALSRYAPLSLPGLAFARAASEELGL